MKKPSLYPSSSTDQFHFAPFPLKLLFFPVYKTDTIVPCLPHTNVQRLALSLAPTGVTELCSNCADPFMEKKLNKEMKLPTLEDL